MSSDPKILLASIRDALRDEEHPVHPDIAADVEKDAGALAAEVERLTSALADEQAEVRSLAERGMARGAELDETRTKLSALSVLNEALRAEVARLDALTRRQTESITWQANRITAADALLRKVEWSSPGGDGRGFCPACEGSIPVRDAFGVVVGGHRPDCRLAAFVNPPK